MRKEGEVVGGVGVRRERKEVGEGEEEVGETMGEEEEEVVVEVEMKEEVVVEEVVVEVHPGWWGEE